ncbi:MULTISPECIES: hypothetical protein [unclassified Diaminobutyricimonas]|uniref:hypothetical protein n=1 Tax=unclassified Diaminobutyricimonas TaxID=2643261 RepID=UPI0012F4C04A|nr:MULTISPECIES: hypothetical protein [unclassified Diaminobutyricimonas]
MMVLVIVLLVLWAVLTVVGFAIEGLAWLGVVGIILIIGTAVVAFLRRSTLKRQRGTGV